MAWSYSGNPGASQLDELRFWVQDTDIDTQLLSDEECLYLIQVWLPKTNSIIFTAAVACEVIAAKYAGEVSISADGVSVATSELQERYARLAARLRDQYKADTAASTSPLVTGMLWDDTYDASIRPLRFGIGSMDNAEAGRQDYGDYDPGNWDFAVNGISPWFREAAAHPVAAALLEP